MEPSNTSENLFDLQIDPQSNIFLSQTAKWAKFLAIVGFVFCGLILLFSFFAGAIMNLFPSPMGAERGTPFNAAGIGTVFIFAAALIVATINFFPCLFLFRFAKRMQLALKSNDQNSLTSSFGSLKSFYKYIGVLTIIVLSIYALEILFVMIFAATSLR